MPNDGVIAVCVFALGVVIVVSSLLYMKHVLVSGKAEFTDDFKDITNGSLSNKGWFVKNADSASWSKRDLVTGKLTLFTLKGDNWPDPSNKPVISNLLLRQIPYDCFTAEVHLNDFIPKEEWQQAGVILLEDTTFTGKSIRLSIAYNDLFGGYPKPKEILIQAITSLGNGFGKPEEIAHKPIMYLDSLNKNPELTSNLHNSALRIEKEGKKFRFLYSGGAIENAAFKEIASQEFDMQPKYIGLFAIKGFVNNSTIIPAHFSFFRIAGGHCK